MKTKRLLSIALSFVLLLSSISLFSSCKKSKEPISYLEDILDATFGDARSQDTKQEPTSLEILFRPTADLSLEGLGDVSLTVIGSETTSAVSLRAEIMEQLLDLDLYADAEQLVVLSSLLGESAYGVPTEELMGFFEDVLAEVSNRVSSGSADGSAAGSANTVLGMLTEGLTALDTAALEEKLESIIERYLDIVKSSFNNDVEFTVNSDKNGTVLSYTFNNDSVKKMLKAMIEELRDDDEVYALIEEFMTSLLLSDAEISQTITAITAALNDEMALNDIFLAFDETPFSLTFRIGADSDDVLNLFEMILDITEDGERQRGSLRFDCTDPSTISLSFKIEDYDATSDSFKETNRVALSYKVTADTEAAYEGALSFAYFENGAGMELTVLTVKYNRETGDYAINIPLATFGLDADLAVKGNYKAEANKTVLTVTELTAPTIGTVALDLTVTVTTNVTVPSVPSSYQNILNMTEEDFEALQQTLLSHPLVQLFVKDGELRPMPPMNDPESGENPGSDPESGENPGTNPTPDETVGTTNNDETNPPDSMEFHGKFMNDDTRLTLFDDGTAIFFLDNSSSQDGLSLYSALEITGIVIDDTPQGITVSFATEGASVSTQMKITGTNAAAFIAAQKAQMNASSLSDAEKAMYADMFDGKIITVDYGDPLWSSVVSLHSNEITFLLDGENATFTEVTEEDEPEVDVGVRVEK